MTENTDITEAPEMGLQAFDYAQFDGDGFDGVDAAKDVRTPFLAILQTNSKALVEGHQRFVKGARPGMFLNTGTNEVIDGKVGFGFVPLRIDHCVVEWEGQPGSGKFVARHAIDAPIWIEALARFEKNPDPNKRLSKDVKTETGTNLVETYYLWALQLDEDGETPIGGFIMPFKSTNIAVYRKSVSTPLYTYKGVKGSKRPPLFAHRLRCTLAREERPSGISFNYRFESLNGSIKDSLIDSRSPLMAAAYETFQRIKTGAVKMAEESTAAAVDGDSEVAEDPFA